MKKLHYGGSYIRGLAAGLVVMTCVSVAKAVPFASCITNTGGTITFYLNEGGGNVTVTYGDGTTNANYNGVITGTNLPSGVQAGFTLPGTNTTYSISVQKNGSGSPSLISSFVFTGNPRGVDADKNPTSPYFGHIYEVNGNGGGVSPGTGVQLMNSDLSVIASNQNSGIVWSDSGSSTGHSPDWVSVNADGSVLVTGTSSNGSAVYQVPGNFSGANQLMLANIGSTPTIGSSLIFSNHGVLCSRSIMTGSLANNNLTLYTIDGNGPSGWNGPAGPGTAPAGCVYTYHIGSGPLPWPYPPDNTNSAPVQVAVPGVSINLVGGNFFPGFTQGPPPNNYFYGSTYRATNSWNYLTIMDSTGTNVIWSSGGLGGYPLVGTPPNGDWFQLNRPDGGSMASGFFAGTSAVSGDGNYIVLMSIYNYLVIAPLTNGIPNTSAIFTVAPTSYGVNGRGVAWDAADNVITSSSGQGQVQTWSLGITATAVTTGNLSGTTGFSLTSPSTSVSVVTTQPNASQGGNNGTPGTPVPATFSIYRFSASGYASPLTVNYVMGGTATTAGGVYTISGGTTNSAVIPAGQTNVTITITPTTNNVPRLTTTATLNLAGGAGYSVAAPFTDTVFIQNTSSQLIQLSVAAANMYRAYSNDFASFIVTRLGDTNAPSYTVNSFAPAGGTAVQGVDYTAPTNITFNPGDLTYTNIIMPLVGGNPPAQTANPTYIGNLTAVMGVSVGTGYAAATNKVTLNSIDPGNPPATALYSDPLDATTAVNDSNTWTITFASADWSLPDTNDYEVTFGFSLTDPTAQGLSGILSTPPNGATNVLRITCNKLGLSNPGGGNGINAGVNAYVGGQNFSGNYAVRFNMLEVQGGNGGFSTEGPLFGINHGSRGLATNWWSGSGLFDTNTFGGQWAADGIWWWMDGDAGGANLGDYVNFAGSNSFPNGGWRELQSSNWPSYVNAFKSPVPFSAAGSVGGIPASETSFNVNNTPAGPWADVEIKQINNQVTLTINKTLIQTYNNSTNIWTNGTVMLGFNDPFNSVQSEDGAAYYSNLRVVRIGPPTITSVANSAGTVTIRFVSQDGDDTASSFTLLSSGASTSPVNVDTVAAGTFTQLTNGTFQVTTPTPTNASAFYRIRHN